jgi:hypothetical protein
MMTGARGSHHQTDWCIGDFDQGYVAPAKTLALMAVDLLCDGAKKARDVLSNHKAALTKDRYLRQQQAIFRTESFNGESALALPEAP